MGSESRIERRCRDIASEYGCRLIKQNGFRGDLDRRLEVPTYASRSGQALVLFIEYKAPGKTIDPDGPQGRNFGWLQAAGFGVFEVDNIAEFEHLLEKVAIKVGPVTLPRSGRRT